MGIPGTTSSVATTRRVPDGAKGPPQRGARRPTDVLGLWRASRLHPAALRRRPARALGHPARLRKDAPDRALGHDDDRGTRRAQHGARPDRRGLRPPARHSGNEHRRPYPRDNGHPIPARRDPAHPGDDGHVRGKPALHADRLRLPHQGQVRAACGVSQGARGLRVGPAPAVAPDQGHLHRCLRGNNPRRRCLGQQPHLLRACQAHRA
jgi:hypothetical protein